MDVNSSDAWRPLVRPKRKGSCTSYGQIWRAGDYDLAPDAAIAVGAVRVDGRTVTTPRLPLAAGAHRFEVGGPGVSLRWVPADGSRCTPRPEGEPRLRHVL
jgi:hypothetical protein